LYFYSKNSTFFQITLVIYVLLESPQLHHGIFTINDIDRLHTLYAQLRRITLASPVLPRLLARGESRLIRRLGLFLTNKRDLRVRCPSQLLPRIVTGSSSFYPLSRIPHCCFLTQEIRVFFSPDAVDHSLKPTRTPAWCAITTPTTCSYKLIS